MSEAQTHSQTEEQAPGDVEKKSKASAMHRAPLHKVFCFLTLLELGRCLTVSKRWQSKANLACKRIHEIDCSQFWTVIGVRDTSHLITFLKRFEHVRKLNFSYCQRMNDTELLKILKGLSHPEDLVELNLFYCVKITDKTISQVIRHIPNLQNIDLGYDHALTNQVVSLLSQLVSLDTLILKSNHNYTDDILSDLEHDFEALERLDIQGTSLDKDAVRGLREARPELEILGPKSRNRTFLDLKFLSKKRGTRTLDTAE